MQKYITTQDEDGNEEVFLFPTAVHHDAMAEAIEALEGRTPEGEPDWVFRQPVAAGFVNNDGRCYGVSETLSLESRTRDSQYLAQQLGAAEGPSTKEEMMKYIVTKNEEGKEEIFVFPKAVNHDAMAEMLARIKNQTHGNWRRVTRTPVSAGFVRADGSCYGHSESLNLASRPEDAKLLALQLQAS